MVRRSVYYLFWGLVASLFTAGLHVLGPRDAWQYGPVVDPVLSGVLMIAALALIGWWERRGETTD